MQKFIRDAAFFRLSKVRLEQINAEDIDSQFNNIIKFCNNKLIPTINDLNVKSIPGSNDDGTMNGILTNIGNGEIVYRPFVLNQVLPIQKLALSNYGSGILTSTNNDKITDFIPQKTNNIVISQANAQFKLDKLINENFNNRSIKGVHVQSDSIDIESLVENIIADKMASNYIVDSMIMRITGDKFQDASFTSNQLSNISGYVQEKLNQVSNIEYSSQLTDDNFTLRDQSNLSAFIADRTFPDYRIPRFGARVEFNSRNISYNLLQAQAIVPEHIILKSVKIPYGYTQYIQSYNLSDELKAVLVRHGGLRV